MNPRRRHLGLGLLAAVLALVPTSASAQYLGGRVPGDSGLQSGTQADPGLYLATMYLRYESDTLRNRDGDRIALPGGSGSITANGFAAGLLYVTGLRLLGANYGLMLFPAFSDNQLEAPILGLDQSTDFGFADLYFQPINLGWRIERADFLVGLGIYAPTGRFDADAADNLGLGMWGFEPFAGTTVYLDEARSWHIATTLFYEMHTGKAGTDVRVGDILTLQGGLGKSFLDGAVSIGVAYYAQWKVTDDDLGRATESLLGGRRIGRHRGFGVGPELTLPIMTKTRLLALVTARYFWETGVRTNLEGRSLVIGVTVPIPGVPLP